MKHSGSESDHTILETTTVGNGDASRQGTLDPADAKHSDLIGIPASSSGTDRFCFELTRRFVVGASVVESPFALIIGDMYAFGNSIQLALIVDSKPAWATLEGAILFAGEKFLAVSQSPESNRETGKFEVVVLKLVDGKLQGLTSEEFDWVYFHMHVSVQKSEGRNLCYMEQFLGPIRHWKDELP